MQYTALNNNELLGVLERAPSLSAEEKDKLLSATAIRFQQILASKSNQVAAIHKQLELAITSIESIQDKIDITYD